MRLHIDSEMETSIYQQIAHDIRRSIAIGSIRKGEQIPSVREVAIQLNVNPNTVLRAYKVLEEEGLIVMKTGKGTFLVKGSASEQMRECMDLLVKHVDRALTEARLLLMEKDQLLKLFNQRLRRFYKE